MLKYFGISNIFTIFAANFQIISKFRNFITTMFQIGDNVTIKHGLFINYDGTIENKFDYNGNIQYAVVIFKNKSVDSKYVTTCSESDIVHSTRKNNISIKDGRLWQS